VPLACIAPKGNFWDFVAATDSRLLRSTQAGLANVNRRFTTAAAVILHIPFATTFTLKLCLCSFVLFAKMSANAISRKQLIQFLRDNGTRNNYYIEYNGFLSNHLAHAAVAFYHMGANVDQLETFGKAYITKLEPTDGKAFQTQQQSAEEEKVTLFTDCARNNR
jgi:hypothetical protein